METNQISREQEWQVRTEQMSGLKTCHSTAIIIVNKSIGGMQRKEDANGEIPLYASPGLGTGRGKGCGCGLGQAEPFSLETLRSIYPRKFSQIHEVLLIVRH